MKISLVIIFFFCLIVFSACSKSGCDDCTYQKQEFCKGMFDVNCNGAFLTTNIDNMTKSCGKDETNNYIDTATQNCKAGTLVCPTSTCE